MVISEEEKTRVIQKIKECWQKMEILKNDISWAVHRRLKEYKKNLLVINKLIDYLENLMHFTDL